MQAAAVEGRVEGSCGERKPPHVGLHEAPGPVLTGGDREGIDRQIDPHGRGAEASEEAHLGPVAAAEAEDAASGRGNRPSSIAWVSSGNGTDRCQ